MKQSQLAACIAGHAPRPVTAAGPLVELLQARHGANLRAVLLYGSCLHSGDLKGLFDLYAVVDSYEAAHRTRLAAWLNALLPPNVYYLEAEFGPNGGGAQKMRAKYALLSLKDLKKGVSRRWFHSYLWARFCQPAALVWARDSATAQEIYAAFATAVSTFISRILPLLPARWSTQELWQEGLSWTYRAEFRPERPERQAQLFKASAAYYRAITPLALAGMEGVAPLAETAGTAETRKDREYPEYQAEIASSRRRLARLAWQLRIVEGKLLSLLRLMKGALTFQGGVDYIVWKIERHSGVHMEVGPFLRRHPLLALCALSVRLYLKGGVR